MLTKTTLWVCGALLFSASIGCGRSELPFTDDSKDTLAFAKSIKQMVLSSSEEIKKSPQPDTIRVIVQTLSELDACPTGDYLKTYQELHRLAAELLNQAEKGKPADLPTRLSEIVKLANTLPGEVKIEKSLGND